jgi:hypothetical protein
MHWLVASRCYSYSCSAPSRRQLRRTWGIGRAISAEMIVILALIPPLAISGDSSLRWHIM